MHLGLSSEPFHFKDWCGLPPARVVRSSCTRAQRAHGIGR